MDEWNPWSLRVEKKEERKKRSLKPSTWENWGWLHILQNNGQKSELSRVTQWKKVLWFMILGEVVIPLSHLCVCCCALYFCNVILIAGWWREDFCYSEYSNLHQFIFILNHQPVIMWLIASLTNCFFNLLVWYFIFQAKLLPFRNKWVSNTTATKKDCNATT